MARILFAEDDEAVQQSFTTALKRQGHTVVPVANGEEAWHYIEWYRDFDLLITDYRMPKMLGLTLIGKIRNDDRFYELPIIMMTGDTQVPTTGEKLQDVCTSYKAHFMAKPADLSEFLKLVDEAMGLPKLKEKAS